MPHSEWMVTDWLLKIEQLTHIRASVHHIISHHTLTSEDTLNALHIPLPSYTVDFHLINLVCTEFTLPFIQNLLSFHPFIRFPQQGLEDLDSAHTGILVHVLDTSIPLEEKLFTIIQTGIRVCLITMERRYVSLIYHSKPILP